MKKCFKCGVEKDRSCFYKHKAMKDGLLGKCKECTKKDTSSNPVNYGVTEKGVIRVIYKTQKSNSKNRGHELPSYSKDQLSDFLYENGYKSLYDKWVSSGFNQGLKPSIDRIDSLKPYSIDNIRLMTWSENREMQVIDILTGQGSSGKRCKPVRVTNALTGDSKELPSQSSVDRYLGFCKGFTNSLFKRGINVYDGYLIERI